MSGKADLYKELMEVVGKKALPVASGALATLGLTSSAAQAANYDGVSDDLLNDAMEYSISGKIPPTRVEGKRKEEDTEYNPKFETPPPPEQRLGWWNQMVTEYAETKKSQNEMMTLGSKGALDSIGGVRGNPLEKLRGNVPGLSHLLEASTDVLGYLNDRITSAEQKMPKVSAHPKQSQMLAVGSHGMPVDLNAMRNLLTPKERGKVREDLTRGLGRLPGSLLGYMGAKDWYDSHLGEEATQKWKDVMQVAFPDSVVNPGTAAEIGTYLLGYTAFYNTLGALRKAKLGESWLDLAKSGKGMRALWEMAGVTIPVELLSGVSTEGAFAGNILIPGMIAGAASKPVVGAAKATVGKGFEMLWKQAAGAAFGALEKIPTNFAWKGKQYNYVGKEGERNWLQILQRPSTRLWRYTAEGQQAMQDLVRDQHVLQQEGRLSAEMISNLTKEKGANEVLYEMLRTPPKDWAREGIALDALNPAQKGKLLDAYSMFDVKRKEVADLAASTVQSTKAGSQTVWLQRAKATLPRAEKAAEDWVRGREQGIRFLGFRTAATQRKAVGVDAERYVPVWGYTDQLGQQKVVSLNDAQTLNALKEGKMPSKLVELADAAKLHGTTVEDLLAPTYKYANQVKITDKLNRTFLDWDLKVNNYDTYVARIFQKHWNDLPLEVRNAYGAFKAEADMSTQMSSMNMMATSMARYSKKNYLPEELEEALDPLLDMAALSHAQYVSAKGDLLLSKSFRTMAGNPNLSLSKGEMDALRSLGQAGDLREVKLGGEAVHMPAMSKGNTLTMMVDQGKGPQQFILVPDNVDRYGMLANKWLNQDSFFELTTMVLPSGNQGVSQKLLQMFKFGVTVMNPKTHARNIYSNVILNHSVGQHGMSMMDPRAWMAYKDSFKILRNPEKYKDVMKELVDNGLTMGTFSQAELHYLEPILKMKEGDGMMGFVNALEYGRKKVARKLASTYEMEEQWAKAAKYLYLTRTKGVDPKEAARDAMESTFNYADISPSMKRMRNSWLGAPFITFTYNALPKLAKSMMATPWRLLSLQTMLWGTQLGAMNQVGMNFEEFEKMKQMLPASVANGKYFVLPWRDEKGRLQWLDLTYILPWGDLYSTAGGAKEAMGPRMTGVGKWFLGNPLFAAAASVYNNVGFDGKPIWDSVFDDTPTAAAKTLLSISQTMIPAITAPALDIYKTTEEAKSGRTASQLVLANVFGLKINPLHEGEVEGRFVGSMEKQIKEAEKRLYGTMMQYPTNEKKQAAAMDKLEKRIGKIQQKMEKVERVDTLPNRMRKLFTNPQE